MLAERVDARNQVQVHIGLSSLHSFSLPVLHLLSFLYDIFIAVLPSLCLEFFCENDGSFVDALPLLPHLSRYGFYF